MWVVRELVLLVVRIAVFAAAVIVLAAALALASPLEFQSAARILFIALGCLLLALAGVGSGSNLERYMDQNVTKVYWGTIPGFQPLARHPGQPTIAPGAAFFLSGLVVIVLGLAV